MKPKKRMYCPHCGHYLDINADAEVPIYCGDCYFIDIENCKPMTPVRPEKVQPL